MKNTTFFAAMACLGFATSGSAAQVYFNDFESAVGSELALTGGGGVLGLDIDRRPASQFLGLSDSLSNGGLDNNEVTLSLSGLAPHSSVIVSFEAYIMRTMDGGSTCCGPDYFVYKLGTFTRTTTFGGWTQAFPNFIETGGSPSDFRVHTEGIPTGSGKGVFFPVTFTIPHTGSTLAMSFSMSGLQGVDDEGWGLDNILVEISQISPIPEPSTFALLGLGALVVGLRACRNRRAAVG